MNPQTGSSPKSRRRAGKGAGGQRDRLRSNKEYPLTEETGGRRRKGGGRGGCH